MRVLHRAFSIVPPLPFDAKSIGQRIARVRKSRSWRQADLARALGVKQGTVANWECGVRTPSIGNLVKLSAALRRKLDWLMFGKCEAVR